MLFPSREREFISGSRNAVPESQICPRGISKSRISIKAAILAGIAAVFSMSPYDAEAEPKKPKGSKPAAADQLSRTAASGVFIVVPSEFNPEGNLLRGDSLKGFIDDPSTNWCEDCMIRVRCKEPKVVAPPGLTTERGKDILVGPMKELYGRDISVRCADDAEPRKIEVPLPASLQRVAAGVLLGAMKGQAAAHEEAQRASQTQTDVEPKHTVKLADADSTQDEQEAEAVVAGQAQDATSDADSSRTVGAEAEASAQVQPQEQGVFSEDHSFVTEAGAVTPLVSSGDFFGQTLSKAGVYVAVGRELSDERGDLRCTLRVRRISQGVTEQDSRFRPVDPERRLSGVAIDGRIGASIRRRIMRIGAVRVDASVPVGVGWSFIHVEGGADAAVSKEQPFELADVPANNTGAVGAETCPGITVGIGNRMRAVLRACGSMLFPTQIRAGDSTRDVVFSLDGEAGLGGNF